MKKLGVFLITIITLSISCNLEKSKKEDNSSSNVKQIQQEIKPSVKTTNASSIETNNFHVVKIDSLQTFYIIYTKKENIDYKIVSEKIELSKNCNKVKKGDYLALKLISIVPDTSKISYKIGGVGYNGVDIDFEGDSILDIYESKNLVGLCYFPKK